jgi:membrane protein implicated in regulation of membrane protease activity
MIHLGWIDTLPMSFMVCGIMAVGFVIPMQFLFKSFCVGATSKSNIDEDVDCFGKIVVVIHDIGEEHNNGRINFQGTEWAACSHQVSIDAGGKAKIIGRENLVWVVEAL